jgi:hypothetical protein
MSAATNEELSKRMSNYDGAQAAVLQWIVNMEEMVKALPDMSFQQEKFQKQRDDVIQLHAVHADFKTEVWVSLLSSA